MYPDVLDLRDFYKTPLGLAARRIITHRIRARWRETSGLSIAGIGYPAPFLRPFLGEAHRVIALMPQAQGAIAWPSPGPFATALVDETHLPLPDVSFDRVMAVHCLEHSEASTMMLREIWRVLKPEGRLMVVVPNRRGVWSRSDATPFGQGSPFSRGQIERRLTRSMFAVDSVNPALFAPPLQWRPVVHAAVAWERAGAFAWPMFSGVLIVEAVKQVYGRIPEPKGRRMRVRQTVQAHARLRSLPIAACG